MRPTSIPHHTAIIDSVIIDSAITESANTDSASIEPPVAEAATIAAIDPAPTDDFRWMLRAVCRGASPSEFFPSDGVGVDVARRVCEHCPVKSECLEYALEYRIEHGVWGGAAERERRRILRRRRSLAAAED